MINKQEIIDEIKKRAELNDGKPLGLEKFAEETGIKRHHWQKYWAKFSDAIEEAGFVPNKMNEAYPQEFIAECIITMIRKLGKFPSTGDIGVEAQSNKDFPSRKYIRAT